MKTRVRFGLFVSSLCLSYVSLFAAPPRTFDGAADPTFDEKFEGSVDEKTWQIIRQPGFRGGEAGFEQQLYVEDAVQADDKGLHLVASKKEVSDPVTSNVFKFTSGRIESNQEFLNGYFEVDARLPAGAGFWPALWLRTREDKPTNGEIDIIEGFGNHPNAFRSTVHHWEDGKRIAEYCAIVGLDWRTKTGCKIATKDVGGPLPNLSKAYHLYAIDWQPDHITWFFDGRPYFTVKEYVTKVPMRIVLNLAMGAKFDGPVTEKTPFPSSLDVRSVKVWSLKSQENAAPETPAKPN